MSEVIETSDAKIGRKIANLIATNHKTNEEVPGQQPTDTAISSDDLVELGKMLIAGDINSNAGDKIFAELTRGGIGARKIAEKMNLIQTNDTGAIEKIVEDVLVKPEAAKAVADIKGGNAKAIGFLVGLVMKESKGKANPGLATKIINEKIGG
jgi:aspartyl-tRNA(Asn)/glutamyl-tRNA(Gln) amidotransferase subunit B